jgi:ABC-type nitrate/sulfonate/bicarbonate transport system substrate-binding protein
MSRTGFTRRTLAKTAAASALAPVLATPGLAQSPRKVTLTLSWVPEGTSVYPYVAKKKGYWSEAGLDVDVVRGYGSVAATQAVGAGRFEFGISACPIPILQAAKGLKVVQIASLGYDSMMGINVLAKSPIKVPKDLEGRSLSVNPGSGEYPFLPGFERKGGLDLTKVKMVQADPNVRARLLIEGKVDALAGYAISTIPVFASQGIDTRYILFSKYGMQFAGVGLITQQDRIKADPKMCSAMAVGTLKGLRDCLLDPQGSLDIFFKEVPEIATSAASREQTRIGMGMFLMALVNDVPVKHGLGYAPPEQYETMTDLAMEFAAAQGDVRPKVADTVTNDFIDHVTLTDAEWAKARAYLSEFAKYLT